MNIVEPVARVAARAAARGTCPAAPVARVAPVPRAAARAARQASASEPRAPALGPEPPGVVLEPVPRATSRRPTPKPPSAPRHTPWRLQGMLGRLGLALIFLLLPATLFAELVVHTINVGQGDATFLQHDEHTILVDAGPDNARARSYLESINIDQIDIAIATHGHADHIGGFPDLFERADIGELWYNGQAHTTWTFERFLEAVESSDAGYEEPVRGDVISHGPLEIEVLHPAQAAADYEGHLHDYNMVVRITYGETSILFPGDAEHALEFQLLSAASDAAAGERGRDETGDAARDGSHAGNEGEAPDINLDSDVLRIAHHGSDSSSSTDFLDAVSPDIAVYSAGEDNRYGHPHDEVLARIEQSGAQIYGTDVHGNIILRSDGESWRVETVASAEIEGLCVNINRADTAELADIMHIGPARAQALEAMRPFESVEELTRIPGIGEARIRDILDQGAACVQ